MKLIYGNGEVFLDGIAKGFEIQYKGSIKITYSPDDLLVSANKNKIIGVMLSNNNLPNKLFNYKGNLKVLKCRIVTQDLNYIKIPIIIQGIDTWELDRQKWEDDDSLWGSKNKSYNIGKKQKYNKKTISTNNNLVVESDNQFKYEDGNVVPKGMLIHYMSDGTFMTGGEHTSDSINIYPLNDKQPTKKQRQRTYRISSNGRSY